MSETTPDISFIEQVTTEDAQARKARLAKACINCRYSPPGWILARWQAMEAAAYHNLTPYPLWAFNEWKTEDRGPLPRCMPLPRSIVKKSAQWLFGRDVQISMPGNSELEESFKKAWHGNQMRTRLMAKAERAGVEGGLVFKWGYDETREVPLSFQLLSVIDETRLFCDPHDRNTLLMARIQYPVWNPTNGDYYLYREEWTDEEEIHYRPLPCKYVNITRNYGGRLAVVGTIPMVHAGRSNFDPDTYAKWEITTRDPNPFGMIPVVPIRNIDTDDVYGKGDLWTDFGGGLFRVIDRLNLAYHLEDRSNQFDSSPLPVFIDAELENDTVPASAIQPGGGISVKSAGDETSTRQAKVELLEPAGKVRDALADYSRRMERAILDAANSVMLDEEQITNKGALTEATLTQMYAPLILLTDAKRQTYGENGLCKALEKCAVSLRTLSGSMSVKMEGVSAVNCDDEETCDVQLLWQDYFKLSEEEKLTRVTRIQTEMDGGFLTHELAIEIVAKTENIDNIVKLKEDLEGEMKRREDMRQSEAKTAKGEAEQAMNPPKPVGAGGSK